MIYVTLHASASLRLFSSLAVVLFSFKYWICLSGSMFICLSLQTQKRPNDGNKMSGILSAVNRQKIRMSIKTTTEKKEKNAVCLFLCLWTFYLLCVGFSVSLLLSIEIYFVNIFIAMETEKVKYRVHTE